MQKLNMGNTPALQIITENPVLYKCTDCESQHIYEEMTEHYDEYGGKLICPKCENKIKEAEIKKFNDRGIDKFGLRAWEDYIIDKFIKTKENEKAIELTMAFHPDDHNYFIFGKCGTGKSHLAYAIARRFYPKIGVFVFKPPELMRGFRKIDPDKEEEKIKLCAKIPIFLLDDLGVGKSTEFANQILYEIIDNRIMDRRNGLIITSNLSLDEFAQKCGDDRLPSRLASICKLIEMTGSDWRLKK